MRERDEILIDLDAFAPAAGKCIKFKGTTYGVRNVADIPADDLFFILRASEELRGKGIAEQLEISLRFMAILVPDMDQATLRMLSSRQVQRILHEAMGAAEVPPMGGDGPSDSATSSPSSPASTAGPGPSSGA